MSGRVINLILIVMLATAGVLAWTVRKDPSRPNIEILPEMAYSIAYDSFAPNPVFADGKTLRQPPLHSVPRGMSPTRFAATDEDAARAGREWINPFSADDPQVLRRGPRRASRASRGVVSLAQRR